ncbi:MAG: outer membrane protein assembly factor BamA [Legionellales bacterium]|nr:outer membrane protein assembly factor BamA [Legionellales bacterium]
MRQRIVMVLCAICLQIAHADDLLEHISMTGLKIVSEQRMIDQLNLEQGQVVDADVLDDIIKSLYKTELFKDVSVTFDQGHLMIDVDENLHLSEYTFTGVGYWRSDSFKEILETVGLKKGSTISPYHTKRLEQLVKHYYEQQGFFDSSMTIDYTIDETSGRVNLHLHISEGSMRRIQSVTIEGNESFDHSKLLRVTDIRETQWWNIIQMDDLYSQSRYELAKELIEDYYYSQGYYNFQWLSDEVNVAEDGSVAIVWRIQEGLPCYLGTIEWSAVTEIDQDDLNDLVDQYVQSGSPAFRDNIVDAKHAIEHYLGNLGYAMAVVDMVITPTQEVDGKVYVSVLYQIDAGRKFRIRQIDFQGNYLTSIDLFRQFLPVYEGMLYSEDVFNQSLWKLNSKAYIQNASWEVLPVAGVDNALDLLYHLEEVSKRSYIVKYGYSSIDHQFVGFQFNENNFMGLGISTMLDASLSKVSQKISFSLNNPHLFGGNWGSSTTIDYQRSNNNKTAVTDYIARDFSLSQGIAYWLSDHSNVGVKLAYINKELSQTENPSRDFVSFIDRYGSDIQQLNLVVEWDYNQLNRWYMPQEGYKLSASSSAHRLWSSADNSNWVSAFAKWVGYFPIVKTNEANRDWIFLVSTSIGSKFALGSGSEVPFYNRYYAGGNGSVRAYKPNSLGNKDMNGDARGGDYLTELSLNLIVPNPISEDLRTSLFADAGQVHLSSIKLADTRYSVGINLEYTLPILGVPITLSAGRGLNPQGVERLKEFTFDLGFSF